MTKQMLFLDWDGTLSSGRFWSTLQESDPSIYEEIQTNLFGKKDMVRAWMRGSHSSEVICTILSQSIDASANDLFVHLKLSCEAIPFDDKFRNIIPRLRIRYHVVLATDNMDCFARYSVPALGLHSLFDDILISSDIGSLKRDNEGSLFTSYTQKFKANIKDAILIDDSRETCSLFELLGGKAMRTDGPAMTICHLNALLKNLSESA